MSDNAANPANNGAILTIAQMIKTFMSSAVESELGALEINCRKAVLAQHTLE